MWYWKHFGRCCFPGTAPLKPDRSPLQSFLFQEIMSPPRMDYFSFAHLALHAAWGCNVRGVRGAARPEGAWHCWHLGLGQEKGCTLANLLTVLRAGSTQLTSYSAASHFLLKHPNKVLSKCINAITAILNLMKGWSKQYALNWQTPETHGTIYDTAELLWTRRRHTGMQKPCGCSTSIIHTGVIWQHLVLRNITPASLTPQSRGFLGS